MGEEKLQPYLGKWKLDRCENWDAYMAAVGVPWAIRLMAKRSRPELTIVHHEDDGSVSIKLASFLKTIVNHFKFDEEYDEEMPNGAKLRSKFVWDGDKMLQTQKSPDGTESKVIREIVDGELVATCLTKDVVAKRMFKKLE